MNVPPGPRTWVPGAYLRAMQRRPLPFLTGLADRYGDAVRFRIGPTWIYAFRHPDHVREVLVAQNASFMKGLALQRTKVVLGEGLLTSEGELHKRQRRLAQPAFHRERIQHYGEVMVERGLRTREEWRDGATLDMHHEMMKLTLAVVAKTLFDADVDDEADEIGGALTELIGMFPILMSPWAPLMLRLPLPQVRRFEWAMAAAERRHADARAPVLLSRKAGEGVEDRQSCLSESIGTPGQALLPVLLLPRSEENGQARAPVLHSHDVRAAALLV